MRIAIQQCDSISADPGRRLASLRSQVGGLTDQTDLIVCPELYATGYNIGVRSAHELAEAVDGPFNSAAAKIAREHDVGLVYGYAERDGDRVYNSACYIDRAGILRANHRKLYMSGQYEEATFHVGDRYTVCEIDGVRVGILICFDVEFPESVRACRTAGCDLVIVPTALCNRWVHLTRTLIPTRALENGLFLVYANYSGGEGDLVYCGNSMILGPDGFERARGGDQAEWVISDIDLADNEATRSTLPYLDKLRDRPAILSPE